MEKRNECGEVVDDEKGGGLVEQNEKKSVASRKGG